MRSFITFLIILGVSLTLTSHMAYAADDTYFVRGIVRDSVSGEPIPYASIMIEESKGLGTVADASGIFEMNVPAKARRMNVSSMGYQKRFVDLKRSSVNLYVVYLNPSTTELKEVEVRRSKYSKRNNPAVDLQRKLKADAKETDPRRNDFYSYDKYERITLGLNDFNAEEHARISKAVPEIAEHVDTSEISGKPFLSLLVKEKKSRHLYRKSPSATKEIVEGTRSSGLDEMFDQQSMRTFFEDVLREIDLYDNDINLLQNRFVSPLSPLAPDFYRFYLTDTVEVDNQRCIVLSFYPRNRSQFGFIGRLFVPEGDTTMFVKRVDMYVPHEINLNWVDNMYVSQDFARAEDGSRLKLTDNLTLELSMVGGKGKMYASRRTSYADHSFDSIPNDVFSTSGAVREIEGARNRDDDFWEQARTMSDIKRGERNVGNLMAKFRKSPVFYWGEKIVKILFSGYVPLTKNSKFDFGPVNSILSFNSIENVRLRVGGMTTANLSKRWFSRFYVARGFRDHRWKYSFEMDYNFNDKEYHSREFPVQSIKFTSSYDLDYPGEHYDYTSPDNIVLSFGRMKNNRATYRRYNALQLNYETYSNFTASVEVANVCQYEAPTMPLVDGYGQNIGHYNENQIELTLRYAPGEKFYQTRSYRIPINLDNPAVTLRHTFAPKGLFGARYLINKTDLDLAKRWWFSAWGYLDTYVSGGHVWSSSPFMSLHMPNVNTSYIVQPRSFTLMNPMEFIATSYVSFDFIYWANGALLNYIPGVKKLKLREVFGIRGFWGTLDRKSNPEYHPELPAFPYETNVVKLDRGPYLEASVGLDNIFRVLRVDYVWRINYRNVPYRIDRNGVRIAIHITF